MCWDTAWREEDTRCLAASLPHSSNRVCSSRSFSSSRIARRVGSARALKTSPTRQDRQAATCLSSRRLGWKPMRAIDVRHMGREKVICAWLVDGVLVDPGPQSTEETLLAGLDGVEPRALLLTHIHFDHAGATGSLLRRWPDLPV